MKMEYYGGRKVAIFTFFEGKKGIISRLPSGKIVLVNRNSSVMPHAGEKWLCRVDFEKERFAVVTPLTKEVLVKSVYECCGHIEVKSVSVSEVSSKVVDNVKLVGGDAVVEYYYPFKCPECSKEEEEELKRAVGEEEIQRLEEEYNEWRENFFSKGLELRKCFEFDFYEDVEPLVTVDRPVAAAIAMKTVEAEVVQKLKDKYSIDEVEDLYYTDLEKYVEFYKEFMNAVKEEVQKLIDDGFVPVIVRNVEERQKHLVNEKVAYQLRGEYAFVKFKDAEEELNEFFKKAKKICEKITPKPEFNEQFPRPTWQEDAKKFIREAVEKGEKVIEIDDMPAYGWYEEYPTYFTNTEKVIKTVAYEYNGITVPVWVFIDNRPENGINEFKLWEWIKTLPEDHELRRKAEAEEDAVRQYYKKKDELLRKWEEENGVYLKMLFELYQSMSYDAQIEFSDDYLSNGREVYESILAWMDDEQNFTEAGKDGGKR